MKLAADHGAAWRTGATSSVRADANARSIHPTASLEELRHAFGGPLPDAPEEGQGVIRHLIAAAEPGLVGNTDARFHAWVMGASHPVGVAADWLTSAWGQNPGIYQCSPAAATAEEVAAGWLLDLLDLPRTASVGFSTGATMAGFTCLAAARGEVLRRSGHDFADLGLAHAPPVTVFVAADTHASNLAAIRYLGIGNRDIVRIPTDGDGRMAVPELAQRMAGTEGPKIVLATAGQINTGAFDDFHALADLVREHDAWLHVDAAFGLWARAAPGRKHLADGLDRADSWSTDGHKWLQVPYDSGFAIVRDPEAHVRAMDITASYLTQSPDGGRNPTQFSPELSRRARGFAVWAVLRALGRQGVAEMIERHCAAAALLGDLLGGLSGVRVHNEVVLNQLVVSFHDGARGENLTAAMEERLNAGGRYFFRTAEWKGETVLRVSVISRETGEAEIRDLARCMEREWSDLQAARRQG
ncbi:pyridoxal phosphate-dependent decarboxylase family protein [Tropicimonas sediminicola]|nr:aminotransferase class V-fold PLP-dependent enzyme [Tropicimonas sediminicola]